MTQAESDLNDDFTADSVVSSNLLLTYPFRIFQPRGRVMMVALVSEFPPKQTGQKVLPNSSNS